MTAVAAVWGFVAANPVWAVTIALVLMVALGALGSRASLSGQGRTDPQRLFTPSQRAAAFARAGNQCEHKPLLGFRCSARPTHGDHVYPWSKGGATTLSNCAALCARCNLRKGAKVPSALYVWRLQRRRRGYFPDGADPRVEWRHGLAT